MTRRKIFVALIKTKEGLEELSEIFTRLGGEGYNSDDFEARDYWNERYFEVQDEIRRINADIERLKKNKECCYDH